MQSCLGVGHTYLYWHPSSTPPPAPQEEHFLATLTLMETALFHAALTLPHTWTAAARKQRAMDTLHMIGLSGQINTVVG